MDAKKTASAVLFLTLATCLSCGQTESRTVSDLIQHFRDAGLDGESGEKIAAMIGATEGVSYKGEGFNVEVYRYIEPAKAREMANAKIGGKPCFHSGNFMLLVHEGEESVRPVFNSF